MAIPIEMPKLGNTVEECLLAKWRKQVGEPVSEGEIIAEIETDKAVFELKAPASGTLLATFFQSGDAVPVFANVCVLGHPGEPFELFRPQAGDPPPGPAPSSDSRTTAEPPPPQAAAAPAAAAASPDRPSLSPRARRFARERHFYPEAITGSGAGGRILESDLLERYHRSPRPSPLAKALLDDGFQIREEPSEAAGLIRSSDLRPPAAKISTMRERIARRMRESLSSTAQYTMNASASAVGLLALRSRIKAGHLAQSWPDININEMVLFCAVRALEQVPELNVEFLDGRIYRTEEIHIGFACDTPRGLVVPVVRNCRRLEIAELARKIKTLARQASEGSIAREDLGGGTFTVTNLGVFGIESFTPILNPPQVAILGVNAIGLKPVRGKDGGVEFVEHIGLSLTCDHQVIDGAPGARFLKTVREKIEAIESLAPFPR